MVIQDRNAQLMAAARTPTQRIVRLVWIISKGVASVGLTFLLFAMLPQLMMAAAALIGLGWFMRHGADLFIKTIKGGVFFLGVVISKLWGGL